MSMRWFGRLTAATVLGLLLIAFLTPGCDSSGDPNTKETENQFDNDTYVSETRGETAVDISIEPVLATVSRVGQKVSFQAHGSVSPYSWDVSDSSAGTLSPDPTTENAIYTAKTVDPNDVIVYDTYGHPAIAKINSTNSPIAGLTISPLETTLAANGDKAVFVASGGTPPYTWSQGDGTKGVITPSTGANTTYTRSDVGDNTVILTDSAGGTAIGVVKQP